MGDARILVGDVLARLCELRDDSVQCVVTSPPYWGLRSYLPSDHVDKFLELGAEENLADYVAKLVAIFREVRRVLRPDGVVWLNMGDSFVGHGGVAAAKPKDLAGVPWTVAFALRADGWWLRSDIVWAKGTSGQRPLVETVVDAMAEAGVDSAAIDAVVTCLEPYVGNCMPSSVVDRPTTSHEYVFLLSKSPRYFYDADALRETSVELSRPQTERRRRARMNHAVGRVAGGGQSSKGALAHGDMTHVMQTNPAGRNMRSVWTIPTAPFPGAHFATFPERLVLPCVRAGTSEGGACAVCGCPLERLVERGDASSAQRDACGADTDGAYIGTSTKNHRAHGIQDASDVKSRILAGMKDRTTVGWQPTCNCPVAAPVPCVVLDPFVGSGTTGVVAVREGRSFVGIELSAANAELARQRIFDPDYAKKVRSAARAAKLARTPRPLSVDDDVLDFG